MTVKPTTSPIARKPRHFKTLTDSAAAWWRILLSLDSWGIPLERFRAELLEGQPFVLSLDPALHRRAWSIINQTIPTLVRWED